MTLTNCKQIKTGARHSTTTVYTASLSLKFSFWNVGCLHFAFLRVINRALFWNLIRLSSA